MKPHYLTETALTKLKAELDHLKSVKRPEIIERIQRARELGDLSENADYSTAKDEQGFIEGRILELENIIRQAVIINKKNGGQEVGIGTTLIADCEILGQKEYTIVGSNEAAPAQGKISNESPWGQAFLGKKVGEAAEITTPKGEVKCKIVEIK